MEKVYFHPERKKLSNIPVFVDTNYYENLKYFLRLAESMEPQLSKDLEEIIPLFTQAEAIHEKQKKERIFIDNWSVLEECSESNNGYLIELREKLINWVNKYNFINENGPSKTFLEIALWAIPDIRDYEKNMEDEKKFFENIGLRVNLKKEWSITNVIYEEDEAEILKEHISFGKLFPFIFSPTVFNIHDWSSETNLKPSAEDYEYLFSEYKINLMLSSSKEAEQPKDFCFGEGWDPRTTTWSDFEKSMDSAYKKYKKLYKERTKSYMAENGYVEGTQKRNKEHFEWLVRYQIQGWSIQEIADFYSTEKKTLAEDTIRKGLSATAKVLDLKIR